MEDPSERRIGDNGLYTFSSTNPYSTAVAATNFNSPYITPAGVHLAGVFAYAGERIPDVVGNVRYDGGWGSAQLSAAYHQLDSVPVEGLVGKTVAGKTVYTPGATQTLSADGFAVSGGVKILLPMLAKGDSITLQGTYEQGAMDYINPVNYQPVGFSNVYDSLTTGAGTVYGTPLNDAFYVTRGGTGRSASPSRAATASTPPDATISCRPSTGRSTAPTRRSITRRRRSASEQARTMPVVFQVGGNVVWTPVKDLQIGAEALYSNILFSGLATTAANTVGNTTRANPDDYRARFSIRRAF